MATKQKTAAPARSTRSQENRKRKLLKQMKLQPNNANLPLALGNIHYRRKKPVNPKWSHSNIRIAKLFKLFNGRVDPDMFSSNQKVAAAALAKLSTKDFSKAPTGNIDFSLGARAMNRTFAVGTL
jgi:hypothetical protein